MAEIRYCRDCDANSVIYRDLEGWYCCNCRKFVKEEVDHLFDNLKKNLTIKFEETFFTNYFKISLSYKGEEVCSTEFELPIYKEYD